ncbi:MAG: hypothetical protein HY355_03945, partial [Armatimonadetes bacterium]|nr:hypothetical protein [Armatimonadota bacterium]
ALALLQRAERAVARVRTWHEMEHFSSGSGSFSTTWYTFIVPDRLAYRTNLGKEGRMIAKSNYFRDPGGSWDLTERREAIKVAFRFPLAQEMAGMALGVRTTEDDRVLQVVTYSDPGGKLHFATWIDLKTGLPARLFMVGEAHYMVAEMFKYNERVVITPP